MPVINKGTALSNGEQLTAAKLNDLLDLATFSPTATDSVSTFVNSSGQIAVLDGGIATVKLASGAVIPAKLSTGAPSWDAAGRITGNTFRASQGVPNSADSSTTGFAYGADGDTGMFQVGAIGAAAGGPIAWFVNSSEKMRIDSAGRLGIGTVDTTTFGGTGNKFNIQYDTTPGWHMVFNDTRTDGFEGAGCLHFLRLGTSVGSITTTPNSTSYNTTSDYRLKEDIVDIADSIERLKQLKPCNFAWKSDGTRVDGFIAHEAQEVVPESVHGTKDAIKENGTPDYQGIDQSKLIPLLTKALQEAVSKIEVLELRIVALEA